MQRGFANRVGPRFESETSHDQGTRQLGARAAEPEPVDDGLAALPGRDDLGALRLRMVAVKNLNPLEEEIPLKVENDGREGYHPNVVLDLDYWASIPTRR